MSIRPEALLNWAHAVIAEESACEVAARASVSRAYYASLHSAIEAFDIEDFAGHASSHRAVIDELATLSRRPEKGRRQAAEVAKLLGRLKRARVDADYRLAEEVQLLDAQRALVLARNIAEACVDAERLRVSK